MKKEMIIDAGLIADLFKEGTRVKVNGREFEVVNGVPPGSKLVGCRLDERLITYTIETESDWDGVPRLSEVERAKPYLRKKALERIIDKAAQRVIDKMEERKIRAMLYALGNAQRQEPKPEDFAPKVSTEKGKE